MAEEIFDPLRRTVEGVATGVGDVVGGIGKGISSAVGGVGDAVGGLLGGFQNMPADDRMALINTLGRTGAALMALGQPGYNPKLRQQAIMALGNVPGQVATDRFKSAQSKLMTAQLKQAMSNISAIQKLDAYRNTPEGAAIIASETGLSPQIVSAMPATELLKIRSQIAIRTAQSRALQSRMSSYFGGAPAAAATPSAARVAPAAPAAEATPTGGPAAVPSVNGNVLAQAAPSAPAVAARQEEEEVPEHMRPLVPIPTLAQRAAERNRLNDAIRRAGAAGDEKAVGLLKNMLDSYSPLKSYMTEAQKQADAAYGKDLNSWLRRGAAAAKSDISKLEKSAAFIQRETEGKNALGTLPAFMAEKFGVLGLAYPNIAIAQEAALEVAQKSLKEILGGQFAQKEGEELLKRTFNVQLGPAENLRRVKYLQKLITDIATSQNNMAQYFGKYGTLALYRGKKFNSSDVMAQIKRDFPSSQQKGGGESKPASQNKIINFGDLDKKKIPGEE